MNAIGIFLTILTPICECAVQEPPAAKKSKEREFIDAFDTHMLAVMRVPWALFPVFNDRHLQLVRIDLLAALADSAANKYLGKLAFEAHFEIANQLDMLKKANPADREIRFRTVSNKRGIAKLLPGMGKEEMAIQIRSAALDEALDLLDEAPRNVRCQILIAELLIDNADLVELDPQKAPQAILDYRKAIEIWEPIVAATPKEHRSRTALAYAWNGLGGAYLFAACSRDATEAYTKALTIREKLAQDSPKEAYRWVELGGSNCNLGNVIVETDGKLEEATPYYDKGIALLEKALNLDPNVRHGKEFLANCFWGKFVVAVRSRQFAEAEAASTKSLELMHGNARLAREINRELQFAEEGEHARAAKRIEAIVKRKDLEPENHYRIAQVYAAAVGAAKTDEKLANAYSVQAVEQLRQFHKMSNHLASSMLRMTADDKLLDPLRKRDAFIGWVKELKETPAPKRDEKKPR